LGASSTWWTEEHFPHHVHTNTVIEGVGSGDPQQREEVFCQSESLRPYIPNIACKLLVKLQNILFVPILILFGRFGLCGASYTMQRGKREHVGVAIHWIWVVALLCQCDSLFNAVVLWYGGAVVQGLLGLFLCLGHYDKDFVEKSESMKMSWLRRQIAVTKDVDAPFWCDWFFGGLNLHTVHHLLPRLCRSKYREVDVKLRELYAKHGIKIDRVPFSQALYDVLTHMKKESWRESWREIFMSS
jgi:fatty acid desaturase